MKKMKIAAALTGTLFLSACVNPGDAYRSDVYDASEVNTAQAGAVVNIISVQPAKIRVDNSTNQRTATSLAGLGLGALGAGLGTAFGGTWGGVGAGLGGAALGAMGGGMVTNAHTLVNGVTISYVLPNGTSLAATEVGKTCQWTQGNAQLIITQRGQTRILPNAVCPTRQ